MRVPVLRAAPALVALSLVAASTPDRLRAGLWRVTSTPQSATLDGRKLGDLPYSPPEPDTVCMTEAQAADPARWFARESPAGCTFSRQSVARGTVDIAASCPSASTGYPNGSLRLAGRWSADRYTLRFATTDSGENGRMAFTGTTTGERIGECPATR